ncbi:hypothetical protein JQ612_26795 [Bradyrhizobium manausense]|uniref:hypothetical protein n=1 Tax=Bradyrhizobium manausense TaxID=989370 RepID=UPI001BA722E5|nr:hypothetical protein [Bradyrhizobium manausense]MBR0836816.1 hypothetical protein [Bradyrhizobium manausense]
MHFSVKSAAVSLFLMIGFALPVHAQNNKPIRSGDWYEDRASFSSTGGSSMSLNFSQSPTDKFLNVTHVTCYIQTLTSQVLQDVELYVGTTSGSGDLLRPMFIRGTMSPEIGQRKHYGINTDAVYFKMGPGRYPSIYINTDSATSGLFSISANCTIVGNLTDN